MQGPVFQESSTPPVKGDINLRYVGLISFVAALGGLLFGYDWVVIGGAKPFYEVYFSLSTQAQVGWANSCALIGCFVGSFVGGHLSDLLGRRQVLALAAALFAVSSLLTGLADHFTSFIVWRIVGGVAIGIASNVSPTYIAEVSPALWRGRLVSLNQLALVVGILAAQIVNWRIARPVPAGLTSQALLLSWNVQHGWRWMFLVVAIPSILFLMALPLIPESPRWLAGQHRLEEARAILCRVAGDEYASAEIVSIERSLIDQTEAVHWRDLLQGKMGGLLLIGIALAVLQQGSGINILFNYAEEVYRSAGYGVNDIMFNIVITGTINLVFTVLAITLVDRVGRRKMMLAGCLSIGVCHVCAGIAYRMQVHGLGILLLTLVAIACYAMTLAPVTWVLITEIFPNRYRGSAVSISVAFLWVASFVLTYTFPILQRSVGTSGSFLVYGSICLAGALFVYFIVPETTGRSLDSVSS